MIARIALAFAACLLIPAALRADDIPARPQKYFNDYAAVVDPGTAEQFNNQLADFERQTSNQIWVAVYPKMQTDDSLDDYCQRIAQAWGVGQRKQSNGAVLFVFVQDHKMRIQTGYGLEGALPDATCEDIMEDQMTPHFKQGDYAGGLRAGINAIISATKGEYKGTGRTKYDQEVTTTNNTVTIVIFVIILLFSIFRRTRGVMYGSSGIGRYGGFFVGGGGGGFSGGGGGSSGGGWASAGGGSFGGGGASGSW